MAQALGAPGSTGPAADQAKQRNELVGASRKSPGSLRFSAVSCLATGSAGPDGRQVTPVQMWTWVDVASSALLTVESTHLNLSRELDGCSEASVRIRLNLSQARPTPVQIEPLPFSLRAYLSLYAERVESVQPLIDRVTEDIVVGARPLADCVDTLAAAAGDEGRPSDLHLRRVAVPGGPGVGPTQPGGRIGDRRVREGWGLPRNAAAHDALPRAVRPGRVLRRHPH